MRVVVNHIILRLLLALMAFQIINLSIDAIEFTPIKARYSIGEFNYLNSMTEYVGEVLLGHKDLFPEFLKKSSKESQNIKHIDFKVYQPSRSNFIEQQYTEVRSFSFPLDESYSFLFSKEINPPPPKKHG